MGHSDHREHHPGTRINWLKNETAGAGHETAGSLRGADDSTRRAVKNLITPTVIFAAPKASQERSQDVAVRDAGFLGHTEQIRQIRKIRQIRDQALLLAAALRNRKTHQGNGFHGSFGFASPPRRGSASRQRSAII